MNIERHIFGSLQGYETLAKSEGFTSADCKTLENLCHSFGNVRSEYVKSNTCFFTSILAGRKSLTVGFPGDLDKWNRPTIRWISAVVSQEDWNRQLFGNFSLLLAERPLWEWNGEQLLSALAVPRQAGTIPKPGLPIVFSVLAEIEAKYPRGRTIVSSKDLSIGQISTIEMLLPSSAKGIITCAYGSPNTNLKVTLNCLVNHEGAVTFRPDPKRHYSHYVEGLIQAGIDAPFDYITKGEFKVARTSVANSSTKVSAFPGIASFGSVVLILMLFASLLGWFVDHRRLVAENDTEVSTVRTAQTEESETQKEKIVQQNNDLQKAREELKKTKDDLNQQITQKDNDLQKAQDELKKTKDDLNQQIAQKENLNQQITQKDNDLQKAQDELKKTKDDLNKKDSDFRDETDRYNKLDDRYNKLVDEMAQSKKP